MGYAVVGYFDKNSDEKIRGLWKGLADIGVCNYLINSENNPHFKFAMFDSLDLDATKKILSSLTKRIKKQDIHFKKFGFYPNDKPIITLDISETIQILELQTEIQDALSEYGTGDHRGYFDLGVWKSDCQLTVNIDKDKLTKGVIFLSNTMLPFNGYLERIGLIEFHPAKQLFSYPLC